MKLSRRELAAMLGAGALMARAGQAEERARVLPGVVGTAEASASLGQAVPVEKARAAISNAVVSAVGAATVAEAAGTLFSASDTVGIKVNCLAGPKLSPRVELVEALVDLIATAGVDRGRIIVFERTSRELKRAGYTWREIGRMLHLPRKMVRRVIHDVRISMARYDDRRYNDFGYWDDDYYNDDDRRGGRRGDHWCGTR